MTVTRSTRIKGNPQEIVHYFQQLHITESLELEIFYSETLPQCKKEGKNDNWLIDDLKKSRSDIDSGRVQKASDSFFKEVISDGTKRFLEV